MTMLKRWMVMQIMILSLSMPLFCVGQEKMASEGPDFATRKSHILRRIIPLEREEKPKELTPYEKSKYIDLDLKPNEAGQVMVFMYHALGETEGYCRRSIEGFKKDLQRFYEEGYYPVSLADYVNHTMDVPAGKSPVVLTFDDGMQSNFNIIEENGQTRIDENCAVGIMEDFKKQHPDFNVTATFFLCKENPFLQEEFVAYKLNFLIENGYDVGNHTHRHQSFSYFKTKEAVEKALGAEQNFLKKYLPKDYVINTMAVPYGNRPKRKNLEPYLIEGRYEDVPYRHVAIVNVGWDPNPSPIAKGFDPYRIHRVTGGTYQVGQVGIEGWMDFFQRNKQDKKRPLYISDGEKDVVTVPKAYEFLIDKEKISTEQYLYIYE